jgi:peptidyl-prolyl cis-trans isomerase D
MALFQAEQGKIILDNSQQAVFEVGDKYVVAYCTKAVEDGIAPEKDVENEIKFALLKDKKADLIIAEFNKNKGKSLEDISRSMGLTVQEATKVNFMSYTVAGAGNDPALIAAASIAKVGEVGGPIKGNDGVYMITANNVVPTPGDDQKVMKDRLQSTFRMRGTYEAYDALRKDAKILDKRYKFY